MEIPKQWTFKSEEVARGFDDHVREQLPWYDLATRAVVHFGRHYIPKGGLVYDIGASTGNIGRALREVLEQRVARLCAIEESQEMAAHYSGPGELSICEATRYKYEPFDFAVCFLVLMFLPIGSRSAFVSRLIELIKPGGAILIIDKINTAAGYYGTAARRLAMQWKLDNGASPDEIVRKELSLAGYQRPIEPSILSPQAKQFFQFGEFAGWVIESRIQE